jgi:uncharacterized protein (TIGR03083 family)
MQEAPPINVTDLFAEERAELIVLLRSLSRDDWAMPSPCPGWSVKDLAAHIASDDLGSVARGRDRHYYAPFADREPSWEELLAFINRQNDEWAIAMRRLSAAQIIEMLERSGPAVFAHWRSLDPMAIGGAVSWAGPEPAPVWMDLAREYTERWAHQQQIRDSVGRVGLKERHFMHPVLDAYVRALPHTFRDVAAADGTHVRLLIHGDAGGTWSVVRRGERWHLYVDAPGEADAAVEIDQEPAWRLFTKGMTPADARKQAKIAGDDRLANRVLEMVSVIA